MRPRAAAAALAFAAAFAPAAAPQEEPAKPPVAPAPDDAKSRKEAKVRKFLELQRFKESFLAGLDATFQQQVEAGMIPPEFPAKFKELSDFAGLERIAIDAWSEAMDEETLDAVNAFLATPAGRKYSEGAITVAMGMLKKVEPWAIENAMKTMAAITGEEMPNGGGDEDGEEAPAGPVEGLEGAKRIANETAAIATLREIAVGQAHVQTWGKIDCDQDGIGEYGTFLEMTGSVPVRSGFVEGKSDFSKRGSKIEPPVSSAQLAGVDAAGVVRRNGYCYRIYLPDSAAPSRFTHETGPAEKVGLAGGTARVLVDLAETTWCAYAWPEKIGDTGRRAFFVNQTGDVMQSSNEGARWEGERIPPGNSAFIGDGCTSVQAVGTRGRDGDVWKVVN
jgi:hypothetical protein